MEQGKTNFAVRGWNLLLILWKGMMLRPGNFIPGRAWIQCASKPESRPGLRGYPKVVSKNSGSEGFGEPPPQVLSEGALPGYMDRPGNFSENTGMRLRCLVAGLMVVLVPTLRAGAQRKAATHTTPEPGWVMTWSDEFSGPDGSPPDPSKWILDTGGPGWGNNELEFYTSRTQNVRQENGNLVIEAFKENFAGSDGTRRSYTSARLKTQGRFSQRYGRFEARIQLPSGKGIWPAFWMLGDDFSTAGWPECGEIDIMENAGGKEPKTIHGSMNGPGYSGAAPLTAVYTLPRGRFSDGFHIFAVEWEPQALRFFVDDHLYATKTPSDLPVGARWVYDHPFFVLLNLAVGGNMPGSPDESTVFPQRMLVDYVRVYSRK